MVDGHVQQLGPGASLHLPEGVLHTFRGIGASAQVRLLQRGIRVSAGHVGDSPQDAVRHYLADPEARRPNGCSDHDHEHRHCRR